MFYFWNHIATWSGSDLDFLTFGLLERNYERASNSEFISIHANQIIKIISALYQPTTPHFIIKVFNAVSHSLFFEIMMYIGKLTDIEQYGYEALELIRKGLKTIWEGSEFHIYQ